MKANVYLTHHTHNRNLEKILLEGIKPAIEVGKQNWENVGNPELIYLSTERILDLSRTSVHGDSCVALDNTWVLQNSEQIKTTAQTNTDYIQEYWNIMGFGELSEDCPNVHHYGEWINQVVSTEIIPPEAFLSLIIPAVEGILVDRVRGKKLEINPSLLERYEIIKKDCRKEFESMGWMRRIIPDYVYSLNKK